MMHSVPLDRVPRETRRISHGASDRNVGFASFLMGGFECSTHRLPSGRRLDLIAATGHDAAALDDYRTVAEHGLRTVRDGVRWHLIERSPGRYDWSSLLPMLRAARLSGTQVIWDLCHYGWPDDLDIWRPAFVERFARFAAAAARVIREESEGTLFFCPINEISYWAWAAGDQARFAPRARGRGFELKHQLVRAAIAGSDAIRAVDADARIVHVDPLIHVTAPADAPRRRRAAERLRLIQYEAWDMLCGRQWPGLGGTPDHLDILGVNYYSDNQWFVGGGTIERGAPAYRPFRELLAETYLRYRRPLLVAETGAEGSARVPWFRYVAQEVRHARAAGVPVVGICLYPVLDYPGWTNDRHCETGLLGFPAEGGRPVYQPLADELRWQQACFEVLGETGAQALPGAA